MIVTQTHQLYHSLHELRVLCFHNRMADTRFRSGINGALNEIGKPSQYGARRQMARSVLLERTAEFTLTSC